MARSIWRWIYRLVFLVGIFGPTCGMVWWAIASYQQRRLDRWVQNLESWCGDQFGFKVRVGHVARNERLIRCQHLTLSDPNTGDEVAGAQQLHLARDSQSTWQGRIAYLNLQPRFLRHGTQALIEWFRRPRTPLPPSVEMMVEHATLYDPDAAYSLSRLDARLHPAEGEPLLLSFFLDGYAMKHPAKIRLLRSTFDNGGLHVIVDTQGNWLPTRLAATWMPSVARLGKDCEFSGIMHLVLSSNTWHVEQLEGTWRNLDLYQWITEQFPHHLLTGLARLQLQNARWSEGRVEQCDGRFEVDKGIISRSLLLALEQQLDVRVDPKALQEDRLEFERLVTNFHLSHSRLTLRIPADEKAAIYQKNNIPVAWCKDRSVPAVNLIRVLVPDSIHQVPATRQTALLTRIFPIPDLATEKKDLRPSPPALRLSDKWAEESRN